ncbi:MAG: type II secretion system protein GspE [Desulfobacteraceae bacterium]|nr:MAG: type II secretion system protein GspE [Desulfobacteraceae bacterium]
MRDQFIQSLARQTALSPEDTAKLQRAVQAGPERLEFNVVDRACDTRLVSEIQVLTVLGQLYGLDPLKEPVLGSFRDDWTPQISRNFLKTYRIAPLLRQDAPPVIAVHDPSRLNGVDDVATILGLDAYTLVLARKNLILSLINTLYDNQGESAQKLVEDMEDNGALVIEDIEHTADLLDDTADAPVIRLVNHMISQAVKAGASDIHIEPFQDEIKVRYRIDGILYEMLNPPKSVQASLISRVKVMSRMNIAEKRVPQDGRAQVRIGDHEVDIRVSTVPTTHGERLVMRLLNKSGYFLALDELGLSHEIYSKIDGIIRQNSGIVLVTGPTGSGKTTTLYAALSRINDPDKNIITIEDPVEYHLKGIGQIQVNARKGVTFAKGLRSIVRQDPDVVLVGEIRDVETAEIAIQSALTGHLVFSTLHTNDSAGAVTRLADLGVEPYLISSSVNTVIAQRLVRVLCENCKQETTIKSSDLKMFNGDTDRLEDQIIFAPKGCEHCFHTGYTGRQAIFEIMTMDDELRSLVLETSDANQIKERATAKGMITLRQDGLEKVLGHHTSIDEVLRVTRE